MLFLFAFMILVIIALIFTIIYKNKYSRVTSAVVFFIGLTIMLVANTMYQVHLGLLSHSWIQNNRFLYDILINFKFSFSSVQCISLIGEIIVLLSLLFITNSVLIKKKKLFFLYILFLILYVIINTPELLYRLYLAINSGNSQYSLFAKNIYYTIYAAKIFIVSFVFLFPFVICVVKYFTRSFSIIKRNVLLFAVMISLLESLIILLIHTKYIHSFFTLNLTIFYSDSSSSLITEKVMAIILGIFMLLFIILIFKSKLFNSNYFDLDFLSMYDGSKKLDKTLRMVLHTYKNMFLAINQLSKTALTSSVLQSDDKSVSFVNSIQEISNDALYNITHLLYMLANVEITPQILDVREIIDGAVGKSISKNALKLTINCPPGKFLINSDSLYMTDLVYNIYKNACDAVESRDNPEIAITVRSEDDWILIDITDNGCGIPKDIKRQIFKPLISNKQGSNNWGIGLYYAKKIIKKHNGHIFVESNPNKYTKFEIYLPASIM